MQSLCSPGDFLIVRIDTPTLCATTLSFLKEVKPVGIHFGSNAFLNNESYTDWIAAYQHLRDDIRQATGRDQLIWAIDHEGGRVVRTPSPITRFPYPLNWQDCSAQIGTAFGIELCSLGINLLLGPSLDIYAEKGSDVIGPRAFGTSPQAVNTHATRFIQALEKQKVVATIKHFPGHGDATDDSHFQLPVLNKSEQELTEHDIAPFADAVNRGISSTMFAHILYPEIDPEYPSSLSRAFHLNILRDKLGFTGVSMSDDLDMKAISAQYSPGEIACCIMQSEINFALFNHSLSHAYSVFEELTKIMNETPEKTRKIADRTGRFLRNLENPHVYTLEDHVLLSHKLLAEQVKERFDPQVMEFTGD